MLVLWVFQMLGKAHCCGWVVLADNSYKHIRGFMLVNPLIPFLKHVHSGHQWCSTSSGAALYLLIMRHPSILYSSSLYYESLASLNSLCAFVSYIMVADYAFTTMQPQLGSVKMVLFTFYVCLTCTTLSMYQNWILIVCGSITTYSILIINHGYSTGGWDLKLCCCWYSWVHPAVNLSVTNIPVVLISGFFRLIEGAHRNRGLGHNFLRRVHWNCVIPCHNY